MRNAGASLRTPGTQQLVRQPGLAQDTYPDIPGCNPHPSPRSPAMASTLARPQAGGRMWLDIPHSPLPSETLGYQPSHASPPVSRGGIAVFVGTPNGTPPKTRRLKAEPEDRHLPNLPNLRPRSARSGLRDALHPASFTAAFNIPHIAHAHAECSGLGALTCALSALRISWRASPLETQHYPPQ